MKKVQKTLAVILLFSIITEILFPISAYALTSGPSTPEVQSFEPVNTTEMVDLFTGDFTYNIPLLDVDGYPINIAYHGGASMDQEASWVGLGWNINPGVINRNMRGIPDDFSGDEIESVEKMEKNWTVGVNANIGLEWFSFDLGKVGKILGLAGKKFSVVKKGDSTVTEDVGNKAYVSWSPSLAINYNNYIGVGYSMSLGASMKIAGFTASLNSSYSPGSGIGYSASASLTTSLHKSNSGVETSGTASIGTGFNSRSGFNGLTLTIAHQSQLHYTKDVKNSETGKIEKKSYSIGLNSNSGSATLAANPLNTYTPIISTPMYSKNFSLRGSIGAEIFGKNPAFGLGGSYTETGLENHGSNKKSAYGYLYAEESGNRLNVVHDFNREKDGFFNRTMSYLPVTNLTYDNYSISGHGTGGNYRLFRNDIGQVYDHEVSMSPDLSGVSLGIEVGVGNLIKIGADLTGTISRSRSGKLSPFASSNSRKFLWPKLFLPNVVGNSRENVFFKAQGEPVPADLDWIKAVGGDNPSMFEEAFSKYGGVLKNSKRKYKREPRRQPLSYFTGKLAKHSASGLSPKLKSFPRNNLALWMASSENDLQYIDIDRVNNEDSTRLNDKHISALVQTKEYGSKYYFDIPAVNRIQREYSFNSSKKETYNTFNGLRNLEQSGLISYNPYNDLANNVNGRDRRYKQTQMPAYAYAYLLGSIRSADYIDVTQNGVTEDDWGSAYKFNYTKTSENYIWRTPYQQNMANFNPMNKVDREDDMAQFTAGSKEIWYLHSVEGKSQIAQFYLSARLDGRGAKDFHGGLNPNDSNQLSYKLDSILLFNKAELLAHSSQFGKSKFPKPLKRVYFEYSYAGPQDIPNALTSNGQNPTKGRLRLLAIKIATGGDYAGILTPYRFEYHQIPGLKYSVTNYDRWGSLKLQRDPHLSNSEYPYTDQYTSKAYADSLASEGNLSKIILPSGGEIKVQYESDDYAYVQNKRAMQMFKVAGFASNQSANNPTPELYSGRKDSYPFVYLEVDKTDDILFGRGPAKELFDGIERVYFNMVVDINGSGDYERVNGYAQIDRSFDPEVRVNGDRKFIIFKLLNVGLGDDENDNRRINPITKATWNHGRANLSRYMYKASNPNEAPFKQFLFSFIGYFKEMIDIFIGPNQTLLNQYAAQRVKLPLSWVRLNNPNKSKRGGGYRVKKIELADRWDTMSGNTEVAGQYGQEYDYTMEEEVGNDPLNQKFRKISSGVAAYEPMIGGDENPFRMPVNFTISDNQGAPKVTGYQETPIGETFFPSPVVGYRKVSVKNLNAENSMSNRGVQVHEFFTAFDFPTQIKASQVGIDEEDNSDDILMMLAEFIGGSSSIKKLSAFQAYSIICNDMHGKPKAVSHWVMGKDKDLTLIKQTIHEYCAERSGDRWALNNKVQVVDENGKQKEGIIAEEVDCILDSRERLDESNTLKTQLGLDIFLAILFPVIVPSAMFSFQNTQQSFQSIIGTKVIKRYGVLKKTTVFDEGSKVETENLVYDSESGEVLLSRLNNEYNDQLYNLKIPAHWVHQEMGGAYRSEGASEKISISNNSTFTSKMDIYQLGDEVMIFPDNGSAPIKAWVAGVNRLGKCYPPDDPRHNQPEDGVGTSIITLIDAEGGNLTVPDSCMLHMLKSGSANLLTQISAEYLIRTGAQPGFNTLPINGIIQTSVKEYSDDWSRPYAIDDANNNGVLAQGKSFYGVYNPFLIGFKGRWKLKTEYNFVGNRAYENAAHIRTSGTLKNFNNFLDKESYYCSGILPYNRVFKLPINGSKSGWITKGQVTQYAADGTPVEAVDALGISQAEYYDYGQRLVVMAAKNAAVKQIAFDGFETYQYPTYNYKIPRHFTLDSVRTKFIPNSLHPLRARVLESFNSSRFALTKELKHSGYYSLKIMPSKDVSFRIDNTAIAITNLYGDGLFKILNPSSNRFAFNKGKWVVSAWIKRKTQTLSTYNNAYISVFINNQLVGTLNPTGPMIEGWQKLEGNLTIGANTISNTQLRIENTDTNEPLFVDDLRIHPLGASAKTFVYDTRWNKPLAILDENNFATFYEYALDGSLERVKKETIRGIMTLSESRKAYAKKQ